MAATRRGVTSCLREGGSITMSWSFVNLLYHHRSQRVILFTEATGLERCSDLLALFALTLRVRASVRRIV